MDLARMVPKRQLYPIPMPHTPEEYDLRKVLKEMAMLMCVFVPSVSLLVQRIALQHRLLTN